MCFSKIYPWAIFHVPLHKNELGTNFKLHFIHQMNLGKKFSHKGSDGMKIRHHIEPGRGMLLGHYLQCFPELSEITVYVMTTSKLFASRMNQMSVLAMWHCAIHDHGLDVNKECSSLHITLCCATFKRCTSTSKVGPVLSQL